MWPTVELLADPARLAAVARTLPVAETARETLDRLAELAAVLMDAPIGFVGLVGAGQLYVVAMVGLGRPLRATRRLSIGSGDDPLAALLAGEAVFVEDEDEAPRFVERWHARLELRAWAAVPLRDPAGHMIGVLGVGHTRRHRWRPEVRGALSTVASSVEQELTSRGNGERTYQGLERHAGHQEVLARATAALYDTLDPDAELHALGWAAVPQLADLATVHRLTRPVPAGAVPTLPVISERVVVAAADKYPDLPDAGGGHSWDLGSPVVEAIRAGATVGQSLDTQQSPEWARYAGLVGVTATPVIVDELTVAVVLHGRRADRSTWTADDLQVLGQLADHAGHALAHGLTYQHTRTAALTLQRSLLTEPPTVPGLDIRVRYQPAGVDEIGGDWYDTVLLDDDTLAITVGDVSGHGITAASAMGQMRATLRSILALEVAKDPAEVLDVLDTATRRLGITRFATVVHGWLRRDGDGWRLRWASAGHPPPMILSPDAGPSWLDQAGGLVIGTGLAHPARGSAAALLRPGDSLLLFTDGLFERRNQVVDDELGHLATVAAAQRRQPLDTVCDVLLDDAATDDDVAILAVRAAAL